MKLLYVEDFKEFYNKNKDLMEAHLKGFQEKAGGSCSLDVSVEAYQSLIDSGTVSVLTIEVDGEFAGYVDVVVSQHPLFNKLSATVDHIIITEEFRGKGLFKEVLSDLENCLIQTGVQEICIALPASSGYDKLANSLGYNKQSCIHNKVLGDTQWD